MYFTHTQAQELSRANVAATINHPTLQFIFSRSNKGRAEEKHCNSSNDDDDDDGSAKNVYFIKVKLLNKRRMDGEHETNAKRQRKAKPFQQTNVENKQETERERRTLRAKRQKGSINSSTRKRRRARNKYVYIFHISLWRP